MHFPKEGNVRSLINLISKQSNDETFITLEVKKFLTT